MRSDDWITKLYITEIIEKQMKYTKDGFIRTIETLEISYFKLIEESLIPSSFKFELEFFFFFKLPSIHGLDINNWFLSMFYAKVITTSDNNTEDIINWVKQFIKNDDPMVFVESYDNVYLLKLLFDIISASNTNNQKLLSIKLV